MKYKISKYIISSDNVNDLNKNIILSTRSGGKLVVHKDLLSYLNSTDINTIPDDLFFKLIKKEFIVPFNENETSRAIHRNLCYDNVTVLVKEKELQLNFDKLYHRNWENDYDNNEVVLAFNIQKESSLNLLLKIKSLNKKIIFFSSNTDLIKSKQKILEELACEMYFFITDEEIVSKLNLSLELIKNITFVLKKEIKNEILKFKFIVSKYQLIEDEFVVDNDFSPDSLVRFMMPSINNSEVSGFFKDIGYIAYYLNYNSQYKETTENNFNAKCLQCELLPLCGGIIGKKFNQNGNCPTYKSHLITILNKTLNNVS